MKKLLPIVIGIVFGVLFAGCSVANENLGSEDVSVSGSATVEIALETSSLVSTKGITVAEYAVTNAKVVFAGAGVAYTKEWTLGSPTSFLYTDVQPGNYWITVTEIDENEDVFTYSNSIRVRHSRNYRVKITLGGHVISTVDTTATGIVAYYPFSGDAIDQSGNGYDGTVNGAQLTVDRNGDANSAYYFNGTNSYITLVPADTLGICSHDFTISVWIKADSWHTSSASGIVGDTDGWDSGVAIAVRNDSIRTVVFDAGSTETLYSQQPLDTGSWYHLVVTYSPQNNVKTLYINGNMEVSSSNAGVIGSTYYSLQVGHLPNVSGNSYFHGTIDDLVIYDRVLTESEIQDLYNM